MISVTLTADYLSEVGTREFNSKAKIGETGRYVFPGRDRWLGFCDAELDAIRRS